MPRRPATELDKSRGRRLVTTLRAQRREKAMTVRDLSDHTGIAETTIEAMEAERILAPSFVNVASLAKELEVNLDDLASNVLRST